MLRAPSTYASIARVGPVGRHAERIDSFLRDPAQTGVLAVALPEEMPVNETVEFERALRRELDMAVDAIVVNAVPPGALPQGRRAVALEAAGEARQGRARGDRRGAVGAPARPRRARAGAPAAARRGRAGGHAAARLRAGAGPRGPRAAVGASWSGRL